MAPKRRLSAGLLGSGSNKAEVERTLRDITARASENAAGNVGVGLSVRVGDEIHTIGATTPEAERMDAGQAADGFGPCLHALESGDSVAVTDYTADGRWPESSSRAAHAGVRSSLSLPMKTRDGVVLGALNVYSGSAEGFNGAAASSLGAFAAQATTSLLLLGELQEERDDHDYATAFSHTVESSLLAKLPEVAGLELVGRSVPMSPHATVSGDWYDALVLPNGSVGLVIGDVMGHDVEAATTMAQLRTMVRAGAWLGVPPADVLTMTDELAYLGGITETATLFYGQLGRRGADAWLEYCNAGHLHPLLRLTDGTVTVLDGGNRLLLGTLGTGAPVVQAHTAGVAMPAGSILLLYTDGLVERHGVGVQEATRQLIRSLAAFDDADSLKVLCRRLLEAPGGRDDTTVFAIRVTQ